MEWNDFKNITTWIFKYEGKQFCIPDRFGHGEWKILSKDLCADEFDKIMSDTLK